MFVSWAKCRRHFVFCTSVRRRDKEASNVSGIPCVPLAITTIMIVLFKILTLFRFKAIKSSSLTLNEIMIDFIDKGTQG